MSAQMSIDFTERQARKEGMEAALAHADRLVDDWSGLAYSFLIRYARANERVFGQDVTDAAEAWGLVAPNDRRAWGALYQKAQAEKILLDDDVTRKRRNGNKATDYRSLIYRAAA